MKVGGRWRRAIEVDDRGRVIFLDQSRLPYETNWLRLHTLDDAAVAIRDMQVRGAPLIGVTAAYGIAIALRHDARSLDRACEVLSATRPTAINLRWAIGEMRRRLATEEPFAAAAAIADEDVATCEAIGRHGLELITRINKARVNVLTHCNAGWLATVDWGTALSPIYKAFEAGIDVHVWVDETRPRNQGVLTAWELQQHGVPHTVIVDNAGGHLMQQRQVDLCIVGTDRTTRNGDVCNKIGTYLKALAAHDNGIPFYAAVPSSSIDFSVGEPHEIPIEERQGDEVRKVVGARILERDTAVANPAFDVTPRRLMSGLITERGIADPNSSSLAALFPERVR
jgi:methylthioribose-1-phosphate isomerase